VRGLLVAEAHGADAGGYLRSRSRSKRKIYLVHVSPEPFTMSLLLLQFSTQRDFSAIILLFLIYTRIPSYHHNLSLYGQEEREIAASFSVRRGLQRPAAGCTSNDQSRQTPRGVIRELVVSSGHAMPCHDGSGKQTLVWFSNRERDTQYESSWVDKSQLSM